MGSSRTPELFSGADTLGCNLITDDNETLTAENPLIVLPAPFRHVSCPWVQFEVDFDKVFNKHGRVQSKKKKAEEEVREQY